ncbi:hypothetical protein KOR34_04680 [Posidoniimonas corsicana]|uniref:Uncharacterized protein n=1 Tax=Posidoniimonas corsicana TaxID=1938618 RepID=A0A5C5VD54_9BACT|nr:hypothetical protein [Posidoniimonas corsicana]TWT35575.1 hypothetical protein KOR34_04680 [Posidoniimonas corsicana]
MPTPANKPTLGRPPKYSAGQVINGLELVERLPKYKGRFRCHCGELFDARIGNIADGNTTSCGCNEGKHLPGEVFVGVELLERLEGGVGRFLCVCGVVFERNVPSVARSRRPSCGCRLRTGLYEVGAVFKGIAFVRQLDGRNGEFLCDCGRLFTADKYNVAASTNPSCGCHPRRRK